MGTDKHSSEEQLWEEESQDAIQIHWVVALSIWGHCSWHFYRLFSETVTVHSFIPNVPDEWKKLSTVSNFPLTRWHILCLFLWLYYFDLHWSCVYFSVCCAVILFTVPLHCVKPFEWPLCRKGFQRRKMPQPSFTKIGWKAIFTVDNVFYQNSKHLIGPFYQSQICLFFSDSWQKLRIERVTKFVLKTIKICSHQEHVYTVKCESKLMSPLWRYSQTWPSEYSGSLET